LRLVQRIDGEAHDLDILLFELFNMVLVIGDLPNTVRSPDAAIKKYDCKVSVKIRWKVHNAIADNGYMILREFVAWP
jgi:hypothetical protein